MNEAGVGIIVLVVWVALAAIWLWGLIDAATKPDAAYQAAGQNKVLWIVLTVVLGAIGSLIYLIAIRPKLRAASPSATSSA